MTIQFDVLGIGNILMDIIAPVSYDFLKKEGIEKASMSLIGEERASVLTSSLLSQGKVQEIAGGSAANTLFGINALGLRSGFIGKVKNDKIGNRIKKSMIDGGVDFFSSLNKSGPASGRCLIAVTPDGERSMSTFLGAACMFTKKDIIKSNQERFKKFKNIKFIRSKFDKLNFKDESFDLLISTGVLHHTSTSIPFMIKDHARVIKKEGHFFVFIVGQGGQELDLWKFCRRVMIDVNIKYAFKTLGNVVSPLRLQGILDHSYGEYKSTSRKYFEKILKKNFSKIKKISGVYGADVTPETFKGDRYFKKRFGSGNLRYLCIK